MASVLNTKMAIILSNAIKKDTKKVTSAVIRAELNAGNPSLATKIIMARARDNGTKLTKKELKAKARQLIGARAKSGGFVLSGWLAAIRKILPYSNMKSVTVPRQRGRAKGGSKPAPLTGGFNLSSEAWNSVEGKPASLHVQNVKLQGIQAAFNRELASMKEYLEKKLKADTANYFGK